MSTCKIGRHKQNVLGENAQSDDKPIALFFVFLVGDFLFSTKESTTMSSLYEFSVSLVAMIT